MVKLFILLVIVLGAIAIAQVVRSYEISSKLNGRREEEIPNRDNKLNANLLLVFMLALFVSFIWLMVKYGWTGRGEAATQMGRDTDWLLNLNFVIIIAVFFLTNFLLFFFAWKYVRKPGVKAYWFPHDNRLELAWTVTPAIVLAIIIILGLKSWSKQTSASTDEAIRIELFSKQFDWTVRMSGEDNQLGYFDYKLTNENNALGLMTTMSIQNAIDSMENSASGVKALEAKLNDRKLMFDPETHALMVKDLASKERFLRMLYQMKANHNAKIDKRAYDDIVFAGGDTLYLCEGQEYEFNFRAKDVIHSAFFPHFRQQMNTVPGMTTRMKFTPDVTTAEMKKKMNDENFNYVLMCNKICGSSHYKMKLMVVVLDKKAYDAWYLKVSYNDTPEQRKALAKLLGHKPTPEEIKAYKDGSKVWKNTYALTKPKDAPAPAPAGGSDSTAVAMVPADSTKK